MKPIAIAALLVSSSVFAADVHHNGYIRRDGVYVPPHYQTAPNNTRMDNYGTQGNYNPYTGQAGTVNPYTQPQPSYPSYPVYQAPQPNPYNTRQSGYR